MKTLKKPTLFLGQHPGQFMGTNLVPLPLDWRRSLSGRVYLTRGFDQNLLLLTEETFGKIYLGITSLNLADPEARRLSRMILSQAVLLEVDVDGALSLPASLMGYAGLKGDFVLVGQGNYLEVWSPALWQQQQAEMNDPHSNAQRFAAFIISTR